MESASRRTLWLGLAAVALAVMAVMWSSSGSAPAAGPSPPPRTAAAQPQRGSPDDSAAAQINLAALQDARERPAQAKRNPFRFEQARAAPPPADTPASTPVNQSVLTPTAPTAPPGPPPPPPIPLKFIGIMTQGSKRVAVLSDGKSSPVSGEVGAIILGQYQILKIGNESMEMAYLDGRGRQTIRLTGQ